MGSFISDSESEGLLMDQNHRNAGLKRLQATLTNYKSIDSEESHDLQYPDSKEGRNIVKMELDLTWSASSNTSSRRLGRRITQRPRQKEDNSDGIITEDLEMENLIKAVMNDDAVQIRKLLKKNNRRDTEIITNSLLRFKQTVSLIDKGEESTITETDLEIYMDLLQFCVLKQKPKALEEMLKALKAVHRRDPSVVYSMLENNVIRLNSKKRIEKSNFDFEDIKLEKQNILHVAANGSVDCLRILINQLRGHTHLAQSKDNCNRTPMHVAATNKTMECFELLFEFARNGRCLEQKDDRGNTPLHYAVKYGKIESIFYILTRMSKHLTENCINIGNKKNKTPVFYARDSQSLYLLLFYGANPTHENNEGRSLLEHFLRSMPDNARALMNYEVDTNEKDMTDRNYLYTYNFRLFLSDTGERKNGEKVASNDMKIMSKFSEYRQKSLLGAPAAELYLHCKWSMIKKIYYFNSLMYLFYLLTLTALVYWTSYEKHHSRTITNGTTCNLDNLELYAQFIDRDIPQKVWIVMHWMTSLLTLLLAMRELLQLFSKKKKYFRSRENILETFVITFSILYLVIVALTGRSTCDIEQTFGALALFCAWIEMSLLIGRLPSVGIYIFMSVNVMKQLWKFFTVYFTTLMAFACAFSIILPRSDIFENLITSFMKVIVMMIGEYDFEDNFTMDKIIEEGGLFSNIITQLIFLALVSMVSITLANLIIGLTVQNISELQKEAETYKLNKTLEQIQETEYIFLQNRLFLFLVKRLPGLNLESFIEFTPYLEKVNNKKNELSEVILCTKPEKGLRYGELHYSASLMSNTYKSYIYNKDLKKNGKKLNFEIPEWIIENTESVLKYKKKIFDELDKEFEVYKRARKNHTSQRFSYSPAKPGMKGEENVPYIDDEEDEEEMETDILKEARYFLQKLENYFNSDKMDDPT